MIIRSKSKNPEFIYCERPDIKHLPSELYDVFVLINTAEFQSVSQAALYIEIKFPPERRFRELIQIVLLVKEIQLCTNPHLAQQMTKLAAEGLNWYIVEKCGMGPLPPRDIDLDIFRQQFVGKPFKETLGLQKYDFRKRSKVGL